MQVSYPLGLSGMCMYRVLNAFRVIHICNLCRSYNLCHALQKAKEEADAMSSEVVPDTCEDATDDQFDVRHASYSII